MSRTLAELNAMPPAEFVRVIGPVFEHSPWIAERTAGQRPFASLTKLHAALAAQLEAATPAEQLALIGAHPVLVGEAVLTSASHGEQTSAGLMNLAPEEVAQFRNWNRDYRAKFGFPFVICARQHKKAAILEAFPRRLANSAAVEQATALREIVEIARLRLEDLVS